ncbi:MAG TPA: right-handed parallel beta-helix repeat-containing protein, partial [Candidatus Hydrogenedentes bacterium]|nr:right-handed parallel beta-helix repeat-containing protein [Candidatus Hydrogenedentota bacterium]
MSARFFFVAVLLCAGLCAAAPMPVFHVAVNGDDAWSGTLPEPNAEGNDGPFLTLGRARDALRAAGTADGGMVYVHAGAYYLTEPLVLGKEDSGSEAFPVVWQAAAGETARIVG